MFISNRRVISDIFYKEVEIVITVFLVDQYLNARHISLYSDNIITSVSIDVIICIICLYTDPIISESIDWNVDFCICSQIIRVDYAVLDFLEVLKRC